MTVDVYWHRTRCAWSVRAGGRVIGHRRALALSGCVLRASEAARLRCLRLGCRDVHAWARGTLLDAARPADAVRIGYRLSEPGFRRRDTGEIITAAQAVFFHEDGSC